MKTKLTHLVIATALIASPLAFAVEPEKGPGKDSTSTTVPPPPNSQPDANAPAITPPEKQGNVGAGTGKEQGKDSTATDVPVPPAKETPAKESDKEEKK